MTAGWCPGLRATPSGGLPNCVVSPTGQAAEPREQSVWWGSCYTVHGGLWNLPDSDPSPPPPPDPALTASAGPRHRSLPSLLPPDSQGLLPRVLLGPLPPGHPSLGTSPPPLAGHELGSPGHSAGGSWAEAGAAGGGGFLAAQAKKALPGREPHRVHGKKPAHPSKHSFAQSPCPFLLFRSRWA